MHAVHFPPSKLHQHVKLFQKHTMFGIVFRISRENTKKKLQEGLNFIDNNEYI